MIHREVYETALGTWHDEFLHQCARCGAETRPSRTRSMATARAVAGGWSLDPSGAVLCSLCGTADQTTVG